MASAAASAGVGDPVGIRCRGRSQVTNWISALRNLGLLAGWSNRLTSAAPRTGHSDWGELRSSEWGRPSPPTTIETAFPLPRIELPFGRWQAARNAVFRWITERISDSIGTIESIAMIFALQEGNKVYVFFVIDVVCPIPSIRLDRSERIEWKSNWAGAVAMASKRRTLAVLTVLGVIASSASRAAADLPAYLALTEQQPPSAEDWLRLELRRHGRCSCGGTAQIALSRSIVYYPCEPRPACRGASRHLAGGSYGVRHPMPYYLPTPRIEVDVPGRCPVCRRRPVIWPSSSDRPEDAMPPMPSTPPIPPKQLKPIETDRSSSASTERGSERKADKPENRTARSDRKDEETVSKE